MTYNTILLDALRGQNFSGRPPIWIMRQAGRYLPEYRALRHHYSLLSMFHEPDMIAQVTALPIDRFEFDAAILYSDILIVLDALGIFWNVKPGVGPVIDPVLQTTEQVTALRARPAAEALSFVMDGIRMLRRRLAVPLVGFCGAPFTVACYLLEGKGSRDFQIAKQWMYRSPQTFHFLLSLLTDLSIDYLNCQIEAGVQAIQIFDSWAHALHTRHFREFCLPYLKKIVFSVRHKHDVPIILFCRGSTVFADFLAECQPHAVSLDWQCDLVRMRQHLPATLALQGNLDPCALFAPEALLDQEIDLILNPMRHDPGFIFNLGHGILPDTPVSAVEQLVDRIKSTSSSCLSR